ncbi:MAG: peptidoglycan-associated lipoprotein Pal [Gammaproteobacteria bacterium]|nr:peptidoglycan-associated lipoprotein Pal [Gammaproteobacteria bacterium]
MNQYSVFLISLLAAFATGCASNAIPDPDPNVETADTNDSTDTYDAGDFDRGESLAEAVSAQLGTVIYFDFDQAELKREYVDLLAKHADQISGSSDVQVRLEGHADERGSREYNVGLGERRSQAVRSILLANGVSTENLSTVSFGEEQPVVSRSDEQSYALNRRVEILYVN